MLRSAFFLTREDKSHIVDRQVEIPDYLNIPFKTEILSYGYRKENG